MLRVGGGIPDKVQKLVDLGVVPSTRTMATRAIPTLKTNVPELVNLECAPWDRMFEQCKAFVAQHGHFNIAQGLSRAAWHSRRFQNWQLYNWMAIQRDRQRKGILPQAMVLKLDGIGFPWNPQREFWLNMFNDYKQDPTNPRFSGWCTNQRRYRANGSLSKKRIKLLDSTGFSWEIATSALRDQVWDRFCCEFSDYVKRFGTTSIPRELYGLTRVCWQLDEEMKTRLQSAFAQEQEKFIKLSKWLRKQIARIRKGTIKADQLRRLKEIFSLVRFSGKDRFSSARTATILSGVQPHNSVA